MRENEHARERPADIALAGLVVTLTSLPFALSLGALVFSGPLAPYVGVGLPGLLFGLFLAWWIERRCEGQDPCTAQAILGSRRPRSRHEHGAGLGEHACRSVGWVV